MLTNVKNRILIMLFLLFSVCPCKLEASPLDLYGFGSRSIAIGGAATAAADDYSVIFYNPGRMGFVQNSFGVNFLMSFDDVKISLKDRPSGYDVPTDIYNALPLDPSVRKMSERYIPTSELRHARSGTGDDPNTYTLNGGIVHDFGLYWFKVGAAFSIPLQSLVHADFHFVDEREQFFSNKLYFQLLNRRASRPSGMLAMAFRPIDWFGFGAAVNIFANIRAKTNMFVPDALDQENMYFLVNAEVKYDAAVLVGVHFEPLSWLGIGLAFRDRSWFQGEINNELQFWNFEIYEGEPVTKQNFDYSYSFSPRVVQGGLRFDFSPVSISTDVAWVMWSEFRPEVNGNDSGFNNIVTARLGVRYSPLTWLDVAIGGGYVPSPVPDQNGRTNYVDNDRVEITTGATFKLPWVEGLSVDLHAQFLTLIPRSVNKDTDASNPLIDEFPAARDIKSDEELVSSQGLQTNNPGFPGYSSSGLVATVGVGLNYAF